MTDTSLTGSRDTQVKKKIFYGWWIVAATNIICLIGYGTWLYCFGVFFKPMMKEFGWSRAMTAGAYSLRGFEGGFISPLVGWAVDKYGPRGVIFLGGIISGLGFILMYTVHTLVGFYLIYGVLLSVGMTAMLYLPAFTAIAHWFVRRRSFALSVLTVGAGIGGFVCAPAATALISYVGWRLTFVIIGVVIWVVVLPLSQVVRHRPEDMGLGPDGGPTAIEIGDRPAVDTFLSSDGDWTLREALSSKAYWILGGCFFLSSLAHAIITVHSIPVLTDAGISAEVAAFSLGLVTLISTIGKLSFGWLGDLVDKRYLFTITYALQGSGILVLMDSQGMGSVYLYALLFGIGFGGAIPLNPAIRAQYFGRAAFGKIQGFMAPMTMAGSMIGPFLTGYLFDITGTYRVSFMVTAALTFVAALAIPTARPDFSHRSEDIPHNRPVLP
jgi:MFS family permease